MTRRVGVFTGGAAALLMLAGLWQGAAAQDAGEAESWVGDSLKDHAAIVAADHCLGSFDLVQPDPAADSGLIVEGWAWDPETGEVPETVLLVGGDGTIVGYGSSGKARPDVRETVSKVTSEESGWTGTVEPGTDLTAYALLDGGEACPLPKPE